MPSTRARAEGLLADAAWSAWTELGVRGVERRHQSWSIDPEALLLLTSLLASADPRLRDEVVEWCLENRRQLSRIRLGSLIRSVPDTLRAAVGPYMATLAANAPGSWPGPTKAWPIRRRGRAEPPKLERPAAIRLRVRVIFGVSARSELVHTYLSAPDHRFTLAEFANATGYTKANLSRELEGFVNAGLVRRSTAANAHLYGLVDAQRLQRFVGPAPEWFPGWKAIAVVSDRILNALASAESSSQTAASVDIAATLRDDRDAFDAAGFSPRPADATGAELTDWFEAASLSFLDTLAAGERPPDQFRSPALAK